MNGYFYWAIILGVTFVGALLAWIFFSTFQRTNTASGRTVKASLFARIARAGTLALFLTPSLAGWFPCPYILAVAWYVILVGPMDPIACLQGIWPLTKVYLAFWVIIFFIVEKFFTPKGAVEIKT